MREVQRLGLRPLYDQNHAARLQVRHLMALSFAPLALVRNAFQQLRAAAMQALNPLFDYFANTWLPQTNPPAAGTFRPQMWNVYDVDIRTTNDLEGWHHKMNNLLRKHHPNIWALLTAIREEQSVTEVTVQQITAGRVVKRKKKAYKECQRRIDNLRSDYRNGAINVIDLITGVSHNLAGN
jgi:hypothetical protein